MKNLIKILAGYLKKRTRYVYTRYVTKRHLYKKLDIKNLDKNFTYIKSLPLVSICIPTYKYSFFEPALQSALNQTYNNTEIIICDDSSDKYIENIIGKYKDNRIVYVKNPVNIGARENYKKCLNLSSGKYIKFLNDDDLLHIDCAQTMVEYFECYGDKVSLITSNKNIIDKNGNIIENLYNILSITKNVYIKGRNLGNFILKNISNVIGEPTTVMFKKKDTSKIPHGIFNLKDGKSYHYLGNTDIVMWLNLLTLGDAIYIAKPLSSFRHHDEQITNDMNAHIRCLIDWFRIIKNAREIGYLTKNKDFKLSLFNYRKLLKNNYKKFLLENNDKKYEIKKTIDEVETLLNIVNQ
jgi:glycosyltransferase involved in cell wall biosynthesis